jgi:hypothetical protein
MTSPCERRAAALEAIGHALLELAALEREPEESAPTEVLINRRNCVKELGLAPGAFLEAAGTAFPAFRISRTVTATKADVLAWLKSRQVAPKVPREKPAVSSPSPADPDEFLKLVHDRFVAREGRPMTDDELDLADTWADIGRKLRAEIEAGRLVSRLPGGGKTDTPDDIAARGVKSKIGQELPRHANWRSLGLDPADMERRADELRRQLIEQSPEMNWRQRVNAVWEMWGTITEPLEQARKAERAAARAARKAQKAAAGLKGGPSQPPPK